MLEAVGARVRIEAALKSQWSRPGWRIESEKHIMEVALRARARSVEAERAQRQFGAEWNPGSTLHGG